MEEGWGTSYAEVSARDKEGKEKISRRYEI
jgi:hypothetical protein